MCFQKIIDVVKLLRPKQWYKNFLVFAAVFFSGNFLNVHLLKMSFFGFILLCVISSANYIINDLIDCKKDRLNPDKKLRPIASGKISKGFAGILAVILFALGFFLAYLMHVHFFVACLVLSIATYVYSIYFKNVLFADILFISFNFVVRALAGVYLIGVDVSVWFLLEIMFFSLFLVSGKRYGDLSLLSTSAHKYKPVLKQYTKEILRQMIGIFLACLVVIYGLYVDATGKTELFFLYPFLLFLLLRYYYLILQGHPSIQNPEDFLYKNRDWHLLVGFAVFIFLAFLLYY